MAEAGPSTPISLPPRPSSVDLYEDAKSGSSRTPESENLRSRMRIFDRKPSKASKSDEKSRPHIAVHLRNPVTDTGPLLSLPSAPPTSPMHPFTFPGEVDLSERSRREKRLLLKEERRAAKEKHAIEARALTREILTRAALVGGLESGNKDGKGVSASSLMYE